MFSKIKQFIKNFDEKILKSNESVERTHTFKGERVQKRVHNNFGGPIPTREQYFQEFRLDPEIRMQSRILRLKHFGYFLAYAAWFGGVVMFIMYRLRSDDLSSLEKEAEERIRIQKAVKELQKQNKIDELKSVKNQRNHSD
ncbi:hypothetical protein ABPG74_018626 [Tetrahymena malaccensis]